MKTDCPGVCDALDDHSLTSGFVGLKTPAGMMTLTELSRTLGMSHSSASGIVDRLQARGLLRRTVDPADGRRTPIEVIEDVRRYVGELEAGPSGRLARVLKAATPAERAAIRKGLALLTQLLGSRRHGEEP
jgi:DNA-binding MarR family transcriptional regulator